MGLLQKIFGRDRTPAAAGYFRTLTAYSPVWTTWGGSLYESELVRAAIDARARHISKLGLTIEGSAQPKLRSAIRSGPNTWQTWSQLLYRTSTILDMHGTAFVVPVLDEYGDQVGYTTVLPTECTIRDVRGDPWVCYQFASGQSAAAPLSECATLTRYQYKDDYLGTDNRALTPTMDLITMQRQGIEEGIKNSATFRFMAEVSNFIKRSDLKKERKQFNEDHLQDESGGILLFPSEYKNVKQLDQKQLTVDPQQMQLIQTNVFNYFGVNEDVLQNRATGDKWSAFYEGAIEPFAIQLSDTMTRMTFSPREIAAGNQITFTSSRIQYMTNQEKLNVSRELLDRGVFNRDDVRQIWNLAPLPNGEGQAYVIRGEYKDANEHLRRGDNNDGAGPADGEN